MKIENAKIAYAEEELQKDATIALLAEEEIKNVLYGAVVERQALRSALLVSQARSTTLIDESRAGKRIIRELIGAVELGNTNELITAIVNARGFLATTAGHATPVNTGVGT